LMVGSDQCAVLAVVEDYRCGSIVLIMVGGALLVGLANQQLERVQGDEGAVVSPVVTAIVLACGDHEGLPVRGKRGRVPYTRARLSIGHKRLRGDQLAILRVDRSNRALNGGVIAA